MCIAVSFLLKADYNFISCFTHLLMCWWTLVCCCVLVIEYHVCMNVDVQISLWVPNLNKMDIHCYKTVYVPPPQFICWRLSLRCNSVEAKWEVFRWWEYCACIRIDGLIKRTVWSRGGQRSLLCPTLGHIMTRSEGPCGSWPLSSTSQIPRLWGKHYFLNKLSSLRYSIIAT